MEVSRSPRKSGIRSETTDRRFPQGPSTTGLEAASFKSPQSRSCHRHRKEQQDFPTKETPGEITPGG